MEKEIVAKLRHLRIAPRKVRLVADLVRGKDASRTLIILNRLSKRAAHPMAKLLQSALSNAKNNFQLNESNLYISKITVDEGVKLKRWRARAMGRSSPIQKKTSHITLFLKEREDKKSKDENLKIKTKTKTKTGTRTEIKPKAKAKEKEKVKVKKEKNNVS